MEINKIATRSFCLPLALNAKQSFEADIILPDYYDTIGKFIKCSVNPHCENYTFSAGKLSISGCAEISLSYLGENNKIYQYENNFKYTKIIPCENIDEIDAVKICQDSSSLNYRINGPKRIEIKSIIHINAYVYKSEKKEIISELYDAKLECKKETRNVLFDCRYLVREINISNRDNPLKINEDIRFVLRKNCYVDFSEVKTINDKVYIKGNVEIQFSYLTEADNQLKHDNISLPFSEVIDFYGIEEDNICEIVSSQVYITCNILNKSVTDNDLEFDASISILLNSYKSGEIAYIDDVYSLENDVNTKFDSFAFIENSEKVRKTLTVTFDADSYDADSFIIADSYIENLNVITEVRDGTVNCFVNADYNALIKTDNGAYSLICRNNNSETDICPAGKTVTLSDYRVLSVSALRLSDGKVRFTADINLSFDVIEICKVNVLTDVAASSDGCNIKSPEIVLYFAQKNESIWDIAKKNKTSVELIRSNNPVISEILDNDMVLVFPNF